MANETSNKVALEYFKALRTEIIERLKMRDKVLLGFLAASGALIAFGLDAKNVEFKPWLLAVIPFLSVGAATTIAQHQDQIVAFNQYIALQLGPHSASGVDGVVDFNQSEAAGQALDHNLRMNFIAQLFLLCGPSIFVLVTSYFVQASPVADSPAQDRRLTLLLPVLGLLLTLLAAGRIFGSFRYRSRVMKSLLPSRAHHGHKPH